YLTMLPVSNWIMPTAVVMSERALYLPSVGMCLITGWIWTKLPTLDLRRLAAAGVVTTGIFFCIAHTYIWPTDPTSFGKVVRVFPDNVRGQQGYGTALVEAGRAEEARQHFEAGLRLTRSTPLLVGMSEALVQTDRSCGRARPFLD